VSGLVAESASPKKLYLLDGTSHIYRAFYAIRRLTGPARQPTNATYGFTQMVRKLLQDEKPEHLAIVFDRPEPTHRHEIFPKYKANRLAPPEDLVSQIPDVKRVCRALGLPIVELAGFEADDLIGTLARKASREGYQVVIVSSDKDMLQLVDETTSILHPVRGEVLDATGVLKSFGVMPAQVVEVLALLGDSSDNVPGVPGIGEKGARELIASYGSLEGCLEHASEIPRKSYRESLLENQQQARISRDLVRIRFDVPVDWNSESFRLGGTSREEARRLFAELGFTRLLEEVEASAPAEPDARETPAAVARVEVAVEELQSDEDLRKAIATLAGRERLALTPFFSSAEPMRAELAGLGFSASPEHGFFVSFRPDDLVSSRRPPEGQVLSRLAPFLADPDVRIVSQDIKQLQVYLARRGIPIAGDFLDTTLAGYLLDPERRDYSLSMLESTYLRGQESSSAAPRAGQPADQARESARSGSTLLELEGRLWRRLEEEKLLTLYRDVEMPLVSVLAAMEHSGVLVDADLLQRIARQWMRDLETIEEKVYALAGDRFNIHSPQQLREVLFQKLGLTPGRKTEKGKLHSTGMDVLEDLAGSHPLPAAILDYRSLSKLLSTYVEALPRMVNPETGRVHASFNQAMAATGRLSSSNPNLQNIPIRSDRGRQIRRAFVSEPGWRILSADYSQIELRVLAHLSGDPELVRAFREGEDIHARTAAAVFGVASELVTDDLRRQAKAINFGIVYGMGAFRLAKELVVSNAAAQRFIDDYFLRFAGVRKYVDGVVEMAEREGKVFTLLGRTRPVPEIRSRNANVRRQGIRVAVNTTVQGTAADLIKMAMIRLHSDLKKGGLRSRLLIQVHDELLLEVPEEELKEVSLLVKHAMESVHPLDVPLLAEIHSGPNWLETR
jgi:DNA polymerase I